ncbi:hypothetical protein ABL78_3283 [Leptomonas seymouri]|uniref:Uncharacterized protein n=1 Tax=Leptomonas seymouri TaxID=5684 RepID=A0A0N0P6G8_LEPSE|nr:hypothetical protein ABL78_3283 [Leptomonas seymouri]|eukprot:KPI87626.1 hypothetical protein ABL78_3283 [Leptomonas seymouri]
MSICSQRHWTAGGLKRCVTPSLMPRHRCRVALLIASLLLVAVCAPATPKESDTSYLSSTVGSNGGEYALYTVTGCSECTLNFSQRWCPSNMRCYPANNCTCDGALPCIDLRTCFYGSRPRCLECVDSGGVYCASGSSALTPRGSMGAQEVRCYPPEGLPPVSVAANGSRHLPALAARDGLLQAAFPTCGASTCPGGQCIRLAAECPEVADPLTRSYEIVGVLMVLVLSCLVIRSIYRLLF